MIRVNECLITLALFLTLSVNVAHAEYHDEFFAKVGDIEEAISNYENQMSTAHFNSDTERQAKEQEFLNSVNAMASDINGAHNHEGETGSTLQFRNIADAKKWLTRIDSTTSSIPARDTDSDNNGNSNSNAGEGITAGAAAAMMQEGDAIIKEYAETQADHAQTAAEGYADNAATDAEENAIAHADNVAKQEAAAAENNANTHTDEVASITLNTAKTYAEERAEAAKNLANQHTNKQAEENRKYTDQQTATANRHTDAQAEASKNYTDAQKRAADTHADKVAKDAELQADSYTDQEVAKGVDFSTNYTNHAISQSNTSVVKSANNYTDHVAKGLQHQIDRNKRAIKRLGANSQATANLHYNGNKNGYAVALGQYSDETAIAGGLQFKVSAHNAITAQVSYDAERMGGSIGLHGDW